MVFGAWNWARAIFRESFSGQIDKLLSDQAINPNPKKKKNVEHRFIDTRTICKASEGLERIFRNAQVDCIVNAMGIGRSTYSPSNNMPIPTVDLSTREWEEIIFINLKFPILVTELALKYEIKKVIHIGSALTRK